LNLFEINLIFIINLIRDFPRLHRQSIIGTSAAERCHKCAWVEVLKARISCLRIDTPISDIGLILVFTSV
jgi:hypothetical protein